MLKKFALAFLFFLAFVYFTLNVLHHLHLVPQSLIKRVENLADRINDHQFN